MVQRRLEEGVEATKNTLGEVREEMQRLPKINDAIRALSENMERMLRQMDEQHEIAAEQQKNIELMFNNFKEQRSATEETQRAISSLAKRGNRSVGQEEKHFPPKRKFPEGEGESSGAREIRGMANQRMKTEEGYGNRSKFKKVKMPIFDREQPNFWLFRAERYFDIHQLSDSKKVTVID